MAMGGNHTRGDTAFFVDPDRVLFSGDVVMTALPVLQISPFWQMAISGAVILAAVVINARAERRPDKLILPEARRFRRMTS